MSPADLALRLREHVAEPGRFWLSPSYQREPWLEGQVSNSGFIVWLKRPRRGPPLARARGRISETASGSTITVDLPDHPKIPGTVLAVAVFGWLTFFPLFLIGLTGGPSLPWVGPLALVFGLGAAATLVLSLARSEAQELRRYLGSIIESVGEPAA